MLAKQRVESTKAVSYLRDRLIKKGTLLVESRSLRFPTPGMAAWIRATTTDGA